MRIAIPGLIILLMGACGPSQKTDDQALIEQLDSNKTEGPSISKEVIGGILQQIPSPLEISVLLKESGSRYDYSYLNSPDNLSKYNSNYKKALNLGIYGTDLGYTNIFEKNQDGIKFIASIKSLADGMNIGQFFDVETIGKLAANSKNLDSLLLVTTQNFNDINQYLQSQGRENLSVLLLAGGWLEAVHVLCKVSESNPKNKELIDKIGEQKIILESIRLLISFYKDSDQNMASLLNDVDKLKAVFDQVKITTTFKEPTYKIVDNVMVIEDNSTQTIEITNEDVIRIKEIINEIRNKIIS